MVDDEGEAGELEGRDTHGLIPREQTKHQGIQ